MDIRNYNSLAPVPPFPTGEPGFMNDLKAYDPRQVHWDINGEIPSDSLPLSGSWQIQKDFADPEKLLDTAYAALDRFVAAHIPSDKKVVSVKSCCDASFDVEEYKIEIITDTNYNFLGGKIYYMDSYDYGKVVDEMPLTKRSDIQEMESKHHYCR